MQGSRVASSGTADCMEPLDGPCRVVSHAVGVDDDGASFARPISVDAGQTYKLRGYICSDNGTPILGDTVSINHPS